MAQRPQVAPFPVILNGDMSANIISSVTIVQKISMFSYAYSWSGTSPSGTIIVQVSNDYSVNPDGTVNNTGTWITLPFLSSGVIVTSFTVSGDTGSGYIDIDQCGAYAVRTGYTFSSGIGTLQAIINGKVA